MEPPLEEPELASPLPLEDTVQLPVAPEEMRLRGSAPRRAAMRVTARTAQVNLEAAQRTLYARRNARQAEIQVEAERATTSDTLKYEGNDAVVSAYDENGFTIKVGREELTFGWGIAPPQLGHDVKFRAIDTSNGRAVFELALYATRRGLFDHARLHFGRAGTLDATLKGAAPNLAEVERLTKLFRGRNVVRPGGQAEVRWAVERDRPVESLDFAPIQDGMEAEVNGGQLRVGTQDSLVSAARIRGAWRGEASLQLVLASLNPPPMIGVAGEGGLYVVVFSDTTNFGPLSGGDPDAPVLASSEVRATAGTTVNLSTKVIGTDLEVKVEIGGRAAFTHTVPWKGDIEFALGARGKGDARFEDIVVAGTLSQEWKKRTEASAPSEIARYMDDWQRRMALGDGPVQGPCAYRVTSAEDAVALDGVHEDAQALVAYGRELLAQSDVGGAMKAFRKAHELDPEYHAAAYLYSLGALPQDPDGGMFRVERALRCVEDFYECMVLMGSALVRLNRVAEARELLETALALRPDYAPAYELEANLFINEGNYVEALRTLELADVLAPGEPSISRTMSEARSLAEGPAWARRAHHETEHYSLDSDDLQAAERVGLQLEAVRRRYEETFPSLVDRGAPERKARVLVFSAAEDYDLYSKATTHDRAENTLGRFDPATGQLLLLDAETDDRAALHVLCHEALHQWAHAQSRSLPSWASEGIAEYVSGAHVSEKGGIIERAGIDLVLAGRLEGMLDWRKSRPRWFDIMTLSPSEFNAGDASFKYGQAWAMVHFFMESDTKITTVDGEEKAIKAVFMDYLDQYRQFGQDHALNGSKLGYVYVDTFHQIDGIQAVEERFGEYVVELAKKAGVEFLAPR